MELACPPPTWTLCPCGPIPGHHVHVHAGPCSMLAARVPRSQVPASRALVTRDQPYIGRPAIEIRLMQYLLPERSGRLWPRCVPVVLTVSPSRRTRVFSHTTSWSRKDGHP